MTSRAIQWWPITVATLLGIVLAVLGTTPRPPQSKNTGATQFSAARAMDHVRIIASEPHPTGSAANTEVRAYLARELRALGADVSQTTGTVPPDSLDKFGRWSGTRPEALTITNVIGVLSGTGSDAGRPDSAVLLMAHHDTVYGSPGAADDTAGIAAILESLRAIRAAGDTKRDIIVLFTDGEELGLLGASQFVTNNPLADRVGAVVNLEARGGGGRTTLFQTSRDNGHAVRAYAEAVPRPGGSSLATFIYEVLPNDTDLTPLLEREYTAYNLSFIGRAGQYHSPLSTPDALDQGALQDMGDQTLALTAYLANSEAMPAKTGDRTFFDMFGLFLIDYGPVVGWLLLICAIVLNALCIRTNASGGWKRGLASSSIIIVGGGLALYLLNQLSGAGAGPAIYYDRLAALPRLEVQAFLICLASLLLAAPFWSGVRGSIVGIVAAIGLQLAAPVTAFIVVWPLLLGGLAGLITNYYRGLPAKLIASLLGAVVIGFLLQFGHQFMQGIGTDVPMVTALLAALAVPALGALAPPVKHRGIRGLSAVCLCVALVLAIWVRFDPVAESVPVYRSMKG